MIYLLDTNICAFILRNKFNIKEKVDSVLVDNCFISEITVAELEFGVENSKPEFREFNRKALDDLLVSFESGVLPMWPSIKTYAKEKARLRALGTQIGEFDLLIGCTAIVHELVVVTENVKDFSRLENLKIENWVQR